MQRRGAVGHWRRAIDAGQGAAWLQGKYSRDMWGGRRIATKRNSHELMQPDPNADARRSARPESR
jgi:hypothetical protein